MIYTVYCNLYTLKHSRR